MKKRNSILVTPYGIWLVLFTVIPLFLVLYYSMTIRTPEGVQFSLENFKRFFDPIYIGVFMHSLWLAVICTVICFVLGYPIAYIISKSSLKYRNTLLMLFVVPMWMNFLLRTYAWMSLLERNGLINKFLIMLNLPRLDIMYTDIAVVLGMVYNFLPFMVLPIYTVLIKIDKNLIEAAQDLGAGEANIFKKVIFPLSLPGINSGVIMVFMPAITTFVISRLLGGGQFILLGNLIERQFIEVGDWSFGSAISVLMMILVIGSTILMGGSSEKNRGQGLW